MALTDNLVAYWKLDESSDGSGAVTREDAHSTNDLTDNNTTASGTGIINDGADFELDNSEYLSIADASQTGLDLTSNFSVSAWVKLETFASGANYYIASKWAASDGAYLFAIQNNAGTTRFNNALYNDANPSNNRNYQLNTVLNTATWYHLVTTYNLTTETMTFYVNGSSVGTVQDTGQDTIHNSAGAFNVGGNVAIGGGYFDGIIDEFGIWDKELTSDEVTELYNGGAGLAYPFTGGAVFVPKMMIF